MNTQFFLEKIKEEMVIEDRDISLSDTFRDYPEWSSLTFLSLVAMIDEEFDVVLEEEDLADCLTLEDLWNFLQKN